MAKASLPSAVQNLILQIKQLPGIGPRSAERIAVWLLQGRQGLAASIAEALVKACQEVTSCRVCGFFSMDESTCELCQPERLGEQVCIVKGPTDVLPIERSGAYSGSYHILGGTLSPLDGIGPEDLRLDGLVTRVRAGDFSEVVIALPSDVEGEATANYLVEMLRPFDQVKVTRLAQGMPAGGSLENADELTLMRALQGRTGY